MVFTNPFSKEDEGEISLLSSILFTGGNPANDTETLTLFMKWSWWVDVFFYCIDRRTGSFLNYPNGCCLLEQGERTMSILKAFQSQYLLQLSKTLKF